MARLGLDYETLAAINPALVYVGAFGYGQSGPYAAKPAYDDLIQGAATIPTLLAAAGDGTPRYVPVTIADRIVGLMLVNAIMGGLMHQSRTGEGQRIDVPMFESMTEFVLVDHLGGLTYDPPLDHGGYARLLSRYRRPYKTSDGYLCVLIYNDKHWRSFFEAIGQPHFLDQPRFANHASRTKHIDEIYEEIGHIFLTRTTAEWRDLLERADIPVMPMHTLETILDDPHLNAVDFFRTVDHPVEGRIRQMRVPSTWSVTQPEAAGPAPTLGQHGRDILREAGFSTEEIEQLAEQKAVHLAAPPQRQRWPESQRYREETAMAGLYFEDFSVGQEFRHPLTRTVTEMDNTMFSLLTLNPQPLHIDAHFAEKTEFGQRIFNSLYTLGIMIGMTVYDTTMGTTVANLGMTDVTFPKPVFHGDTLRATTKVLSLRESKSRPRAGIVEFEHHALNQNDEIVGKCRRMAMMHKRPV